LLPNQPYQNTLHLVYAHVHLLDHTAVEHCCGNISPTTCLLEVVEILQDKTFPTGQSIPDIRQIITRVMGMHAQGSLCLPCCIRRPTFLAGSIYPIDCLTKRSRPSYGTPRNDGRKRMYACGRVGGE
jgi:hypothetical protein